MNNTIILPQALYQRAEEQAQERGASVETLVLEALEAYLDDLQDADEAQATLERIRAGEEPLISWGTLQTIEDLEERTDVLTVIAAKRAIANGEDEFVDLEDVLTELDDVQS